MMFTSRTRTKKFKIYRRTPRPLFAGLAFMIVAPLMLSYAMAAPVDGEWQVLCSVHHTRQDDPIVYPKQPGASHMHSFYSNVTTDANSTSESLMASRSNCGRDMEDTDHSAYWVPTLYKKQSDGSVVMVPTDEQIAFIYYSRAGGSDGPRVLPFPVGLRMIAGNAQATASSPQPIAVTSWGCGGGGGGPQTAYIPFCNEPGQPIHGSLNFPNCWNGKDLDSPDHKSHMAYSGAKGVCPASHPVSLPLLHFDLDYPGVTGGPDYVLASGGQYSMHGDFFAAWDVQVQNALVSECLNTPRSCLSITRDGSQLDVPEVDDFAPFSINIANFSATPQTTGTLPPSLAPAPTPAPASVTKTPPSRSSGSSAPAGTNGHAAATDAGGHAHGPAGTASAPAVATDQTAYPSGTEYPAEKNALHSLSPKTIIATEKKSDDVIMAMVTIAGLGVAGYAAYWLVRRRA